MSLYCVAQLRSLAASFGIWNVYVSMCLAVVGTFNICFTCTQRACVCAQVSLSGNYFFDRWSGTRESIFLFYLLFSLSRAKENDRFQDILLRRQLSGGGKYWLPYHLCHWLLFAFKQERTSTQTFVWVKCLLFRLILSLEWAKVNRTEWTELHMSWMQSSWFCSVLVTRSFTADHQLSRLLRFHRLGSFRPARYSVIFKRVFFLLFVYRKLFSASKTMYIR